MAARPLCLASHDFSADHLTNGVRSLHAHAGRGVDVGAEREPRAVMSEHFGECPHVNAVFECQGRECVSHVMKSHMFCADGFQNPVMHGAEGCRVEHFSGFRGREHIGIIRVLFVFFHQNLHGALRKRQQAQRVFRFWLADNKLMVDAADAFGDRKRLVLHVQIFPEQGQQFSPAQAAGQLQMLSDDSCKIPENRYRKELHIAVNELKKSYALVESSSANKYLIGQIQLRDEQSFIWQGFRLPRKTAAGIEAAFLIGTGSDFAG